MRAQDWREAEVQECAPGLFYVFAPEVAVTTLAETLTGDLSYGPLGAEHEAASERRMVLTLGQLRVLHAALSGVVDALKPTGESA